MKILYLGNYRHSFCTEVHLARELESLGCDVDRMQEPPGGGSASTVRELEERADGVDLVLWTRTWGMPPEPTIALWGRLRARGVTTASYHLDLYFGLQREEGLHDDPFWRTEHVFTPDGDPTSAERFAALDIQHHWSAPAMVSDEVGFGRRRDEYAYDVVFVGSYGYHDEWPWRPRLIDWLGDAYGPRFRRFGGDLPEGPTRGQDLNDLYASCGVAVGDSLCLPGHARYWSDRYYECTGRGGLLVAPRVPGIEEHFTDGEHLVLYDVGDVDGLRRSIDYYASREGQAAGWSIRERAVEHVRARHTYRHRLAVALDVMGLGAGEDLPAPTSMTVEEVRRELDLPLVLAAPAPIAWRPPVEELLAVLEPLGPAIAVAESPPTVYPIRLELGSGYSPTPGFVHLDLNAAAPDVDVVGPAFPLDLPDASVEELRAVDVLEHLSYQDTAWALAEWARVVVPGGRFYVQVPDADAIMRWYVVDPARLVDRLPPGLPATPMAGAAWRLLGGHHDETYARDGDDWRWNAHYAMFSEASLHEALDAAGFDVESLEHNEHPNLLCWAVRRA